MIKEGEVLQERYRIGKQIGQGGMGAVYIATDERFGSTVAIKETLFTDEHFKKAFKREARLLNSLKHSALPKVSDHFIEDHSQYIVMEYIGGEDLFEMMEKSGRSFSHKEVVDWMTQLLDALEYLHNQENPVIHRDIKPQNLKLTSHGQIVLLDFGLAKGNPTDANHQTAANSIFGYSRNYASLEQIQGTGTDPRSDLYSLSATVYHMLTGTPPADALTRVMLVLNEETDPLKPASELADVDEGLSALLTRTMSLNANQRPQSAREMREMLVDVENGSINVEQNITSNKPIDTNLYSQVTEVMSQDSAPARKLKTEMNTEVLPAGGITNVSVETQLAGSGKGGGTDPSTVTTDAGLVTRSYPSKKRLAAAAFAGMMILVGSLAAGVYFFNPAILGSEVPAETKSGNVSNPGTSVETILVDPVESPTPEDSAEIVTETAADVTSGGTESTKESAPMKSSEKGKTTTAETKQKPDKNSMETWEGNVIVKDGKVVTKQVTVETGKVQTDDVSIDNGRVTLKNRTAPPRPPLTREQYRDLPQAQKRKARIAMERWRLSENKRRATEGLPPLPPTQEGPN